MFCFQSPFTRASRGIVTTNPPHQTKEPDNDRRRDSETISERSNSASSIRYIDQEMSSSTDTLPGIRTDYLDTEGGLPSSPKTATTSASTANYPQPSPGTREDANPTTKGSTSPPPPPVPPLENDNTTSSSTTTVSWHRKFMLRLRSTDSNSSEEVSSFSSERSKDTPGMESNGCGANLLKIEDLEDDLFEDTRTTGVYASMNDIPSLTNGYSDQEEDEEEDEDEDEDDDDDEDDEVEGKGKVIVGGIGDGDDDGDDGGGGGGGGGVGVGGGHKTNYKGEKAGGCSLPSSPAVPSMNTVPYYGFLSVNGGAMRQESTSTSSPQLSTGSGNFRNVGDGDDGDEGDERSPPSKSKDNGLLSATLKPPDCLPAARSCPNLERQSIGCSPSGSSSPIPGPLQAGPRFKPLEEGDIQVCYLNHTRSLVNKILSSKFLRRWETHHLYLNDACLSSKTLTGFLQQPVPYSSMSEVYTVARWDPTYKYCLIIVLPDGSLLLQASNAYTRDQWYHSILWKKSIFKYQHLLLTNTRADVILRELKTMVDFALWTPLQDERISGVPLEAVAKLLEDPHFIQTDEKISDTVLEESKERDWAEAVLAVAAPLLERVSPPVSLTRALAKLAQEHPKSPLVTALSPAITRCLKHTVDFGKSPDMRKLLQVFVAALYENDDGEQALRDYIASVHGPGSDCPHPRVLPNLVSICVAAVFHRFDVAKRTRNNDCRSMKLPPLNCYLLVLNVASEYADWRPGLGALLQPVPFPEEALADKQVQDTILMCIMQRLAKDPRCSVHRVLLPVREPRPGWIHIAAPSSPACPDQGELFAEMLTALLGCCCRRKRFIGSLMKQTVGACILLGVRGCDAAQEALCLMLEWRLLPNEEARLQVVSALQSSPSGRNRYAALCQRQRNLQELQQKGGPRKLTLPVRATDADVALLLGGGALGNLECLSLAFTSVTSACAEQLIKLPALRYLNLWATQFGDAGLQMISEHLQKLQVLNLCETPVSDKGISTLASLTSLRKLNLNSTKLSAQTFESLKKRLPSLQEFDVRYTEAW